MRYELTHLEWAAIRQLLPNKPRGVPRVDDRRILNGIFRLLHLGAPWRDLPESFDRIMTGHLTIAEMDARQRLHGQVELPRRRQITKGVGAQCQRQRFGFRMRCIRGLTWVSSADAAESCL